MTICDDVEMIPVFRVELRLEDQPSNGPYHSYGSDDLEALSDLLKDLHVDDDHPGWSFDRWSDSDGHPIPFWAVADLGEASDDSDPVAGFTSWAQYENWFDSDARALLAEHGFKMVRSSVPSSAVLRSSTQAIFDRALASEVMVLDISKDSWL